jgi:hypothetical protein
MGNFDPNDLFRAFFSQNGGDPFANLFNGGGGGGFKVYSNMTGNPSFRQGRGGGMNAGFGGGANIFDILNGMGQPQRRNQRQQPQQQQRQQQREAYDSDDDNDQYNVFNQARSRRAQSNQSRPQNQKTPAEVMLINLLNQCLP